jgi:hypothetical protein
MVAYRLVRAIFCSAGERAALAILGATSTGVLDFQEGILDNVVGGVTGVY